MQWGKGCLKLGLLPLMLRHALSPEARGRIIFKLKKPQTSQRSKLCVHIFFLVESVPKLYEHQAPQSLALALPVALWSGAIITAGGGHWQALSSSDKQCPVADSRRLHPWWLDMYLFTCAWSKNNNTTHKYLTFTFIILVHPPREPVSWARPVLPLLI